MQQKIPKAVIIKGNIKFSKEKLLSLSTNYLPEITNAAHVDSANEPNKSAPIPATSPTLSPTLSAIVAGFLGESSGRSYSTFPTKSAPTSAALV
jgi:hypothetical protein